MKRIGSRETQAASVTRDALHSFFSHLFDMFRIPDHLERPKVSNYDTALRGDALRVYSDVNSAIKRSNG